MDPKEQGKFAAGLQKLELGIYPYIILYLGYSNQSGYSICGK